VSSCSKCVTTKTTMPVISDVVAATGQVLGGARQTLHASSEQQNVHADMADVVRPSWQSADVSFSWRPHDAFIVQILLIDSFSLSSVCIYYSRIHRIASHTANRTQALWPLHRAPKQVIATGRRDYMPTPTAVRLAVDLRPSADGSAVSTSLVQAGGTWLS